MQFTVMISVKISVYCSVYWQRLRLTLKNQFVVEMSTLFKLAQCKNCARSIQHRSNDTIWYRYHSRPDHIW